MPKQSSPGSKDAKVARRAADDWDAETVEQNLAGQNPADQNKAGQNPAGQNLAIENTAAPLAPDVTPNLLPRAKSHAPEAHDDDDESSLSPTQEHHTPDSHERARTLPAAERGVSGNSDFDALPSVPRESYAIGKLIARGGMGRIYKARDRRLGRPVAIKELMLFEPAFIARFEREARITGRLQHPAIVPVYEAGVWPSGEPFFSMKLVAGESLDKVVSRTRTLRERLALVPEVTAVAEALAYAHSHRIVHRDLKPANVLIGEFGETVVIDWGLAKDLARAENEPVVDSSPSLDPKAMGLTVLGAAMGTPSYMPPEQACGERVDERADVYALGAILYHVLVGQPAYAECQNSDEVLDKVKKEPPAPIAELVPHVPVELIAIVDKAMARDPAERYPTAREMAEDLKRFETGQLVSVHAYTTRDLLWRWLKRHRAVVGVAGVMLLILAVLGGLSIDRIWRERNAAERERTAAERARAVAEFAHKKAEARTSQLTLLSAQNALDSDPTAALAWLQRLPDDALDSTSRLLALEARARGISRHVLRGHDGRVYSVAFSSDGSLLASVGTDGLINAWDARSGKQVASTFVDERLFDVEFLPGPADTSAGRTSHWLAAADGEGNVLLWRPGTDQTRRLEGHGKPVRYLAFSPDGTYLATSSSDKKVRLWHVPSGHEQQRFDTEEDWVKVAFSPDGKLLIISDDDRPGLRDVATGKDIPLPAGMNADVLAMSPDGRWLAGSGNDTTIYLWSLASPRAPGKGALVRLEGHGQEVKTLAFSPDARLVAAADGHDIRVWNLATYEHQVLRGHTEALETLAFSPDSRLLASGGRDRTVRLWYLDRDEFRVLHGHEGWVKDLEFSPDGSQLASASLDGTVRIWTPAVGSREILAHQGPVSQLLVSRDCRFVVSGGHDGVLSLWDLKEGGVRKLVGHTGRIEQLFLSEDDSLLVSTARDRTMRIWNLATAEAQVFHMQDDGKLTVALSPDATMLATSSKNGPPRLRNLVTGEVIPLPRKHRQVKDMKFSPDGKILAYTDEREAVLFSLETRAELMWPVEHEEDIEALEFSPKGDILATAGQDRTVRLWDLARDASRPLTGHEDHVLRLAFSPDGQLLASAGRDGLVLLWRVRASGSPRKLDGHHHVVEEISFSRDSRFLASASDDGVVRLWDAESDRGRVWNRGHGGRPQVMFAPDGSFLATSTADGHIVIWPFDAPPGPREFSDWMRALTTAVVDDADRVASPR